MSGRCDRFCMRRHPSTKMDCFSSSVLGGHPALWIFFSRRAMAAARKAELEAELAARDAEIAALKQSVERLSRENSPRRVPFFSSDALSMVHSHPHAIFVPAIR